MVSQRKSENLISFKLNLVRHAKCPVRFGVSAQNEAKKRKSPNGRESNLIIIIAIYGLVDY